MPNFKRVFSRLSRRKFTPHPVGQHGRSFDSPRSIPVDLHPTPLHARVAVKTRRLPVLPPEVWRVIFHFATEDDTQFNPIDFPAKAADANDVSFLHLSHSHSDRDVRLKRYLRSIREKHDIMMVCRQWSVIALEVLYECIWIYKPAQARALAQAIRCEKDSDADEIRSPRKGHYIKRLHIETPIRERCSPNDLCVIVGNAPRLENYMDYRSVRRSMHGSSNTDPTSAAQLLHAITQVDSSIRRLSWTNYDDVSFHLHLSRSLANVAFKLEFLELTFCNMDIHGLKEPLRGYSGPPLTLPHLHALKLCLHNATLAVLATWDLPIIKNVSIIAADFSYASEGFCNFFLTHGEKLKQLELAHSSSIIEDHYLTIPVDPQTATSRSVHLTAWCPNLEEFICSADTEWNWQSSDWIAPHALLLSHSNLRVIGIRDLNKRMCDEMSIHINPFCSLLSQIGSLLCRNSFPKLHIIRDMSFESNIMRLEAYSEAVIDFWSQAIQLCKDEGVQLEDCAGMNIMIARKDILHAQVKAMLRKKAQEEQKKLCRQRQSPMHLLARLVSIAT